MPDCDIRVAIDVHSLPTAFAFSLGLIQCKDALEAVNFSAGFGGSDHRFGILESI